MECQFGWMVQHMIMEAGTTQVQINVFTITTLENLILLPAHQAIPLMLSVRNNKSLFLILLFWLYGLTLKKDCDI